jgi:hypothetical protein
MTEEQAKSRLLILTVLKLFGVGCLCFGMVIAAKPGGLIANVALGQMLSVGLMLAGAVNILILPRLLKRQWDKRDRP